MGTAVTRRGGGGPVHALIATSAVQLPPTRMLAPSHTHTFQRISEALTARQCP